MHASRYYVYLPPTTQTQHQMNCRFLLDIVVRKRPPVFQLLTSENESLLVDRNPLFIHDFLFHTLDRIDWFDINRDGFPCQCLYENLHCI